MNNNSRARKARQKAGMNLYELADLTGYSFETIRKAEIGRKVAIEVKEKIADVLDVPFYNLFPDEIERLQKERDRIEAAIEAGEISIDENGNISARTKK